MNPLFRVKFRNTEVGALAEVFVEADNATAAEIAAWCSVTDEYSDLPEGAEIVDFSASWDWDDPDVPDTQALEHVVCLGVEELAVNYR